MAAITIDTNVKTERQAVQSIADTIRNPPTTPVGMVQWVAKNFSIAGDLSGAVGKVLPSVGKFLPIAGAIFDMFSAFSGPSIGEQLQQMADAITSAVSAAVDEIKSALTFSTEKTITAVVDEIQSVSADESATRIINALNESDILAETDELRAALVDEFGAEINALNEEWRNEIAAAVAAAQAEVDELYKQIQELLAELGIDLLKELYDRLTAAEQITQAATTRALTAEGAPSPAPEGAGGDMAPLLVAGGIVAAFLIYKNQKKR